MAKGKINLQANDGAVIGLVVPDGLASGERQIALGTNLSSVTSYHLLQGNLAVSNYTTTQGFNTTLYTGNGGTQSINTGIDMSTQWGNDVSEKFGGLVWIKSRTGTQNNAFTDTIRGNTKIIQSNTTNAESVSSTLITAFNSNGISLGSDNTVNGAYNYASWNFQTTHRVTGTTNHGQTYTCHFNPSTGFAISQFTGSGIAGHEIPHMLGRKLGFAVVKSTTSVTNWRAYVEALGLTNSLYLSTTAAMFASTDWSSTTETALGLNTGAEVNASGTTYIMYGWVNSYFDESNKLIGNYELVTYQGNGNVGNKVQTRGKPAWVMIKRVGSTGDWKIFDNQRISGAFDGYLAANSSGTETISIDALTLNTDGFTFNSTGSDWNATDTYIALVAYDTNSNGGGTYYPLASDTANLQVNNALIPIAQGIDSNGVKNTILSKNETVTGVTYTQGKNYVYYDVLGNKGVSAHRPRYLDSDLIRGYAGESPDYYNVKENKWYSTNSGSELITNGTFASNITGWTQGTSCTASFDNGTMRLTSVNANQDGVYQNIPTIIGKKYALKFNVSFGTRDTVIVEIDNVRAFTKATTSGEAIVYFTASNTTTKIEFDTATATVGLILNIDNISVFESVITPTTEIANGRNYLNHIVYADNDGGLLYVEELPKVVYMNDLKVNGFDLGQTWQDMTSKRAAGVTYTNNTGKPIVVSVMDNSGVGRNFRASISINGVVCASNHKEGTSTGNIIGVDAIVPNGATYTFNNTSVTIFTAWLELR